MTSRVIGAAVLLHGDCYALLPQLVANGTALVTDQPYGVGYRISARNKTEDGLKAAGRMQMDKRDAIKGDDQPFDPAPFLEFKKIAFFGANKCASRLPEGGRWIVWDKRRDSAPDDHSDCELIWTNVPGADRIHRQKWRGVVREGEENCSRSKKLHPNQKPVALMSFIFEQLALKLGDIVVDPFMGSGSTGVAAVRAGMKFIGVEYEAEHFETACARLQAEVR
jgi:site-specific DNA-methyltransferase (adenine-specific)